MTPETPQLDAGTLVLDPVHSYGFVAGMIALLLVLLMLGPGRDRTTPRRRRTLVVLRLLVIALVLVAMLRPSLMVPKIEKTPDTLILLLDDSRSMQTDDMEGGRTRRQATEDLLAAANNVFAQTAEDIVPQVYVFDAAARRLPAKDGKYAFAGPPEGNETAIGAALEQVLRPEAGKRLAGVFLATDGAQRTLSATPMLPEMPVKQWLADRGFPLFTFRIGKERAGGQARDIEMRNLLTSEPVFVKNPLTVEGTAVVEGFENQAVEVQLLVESAPQSGKMDVVDTKRVQGSRAAGEIGERLTFEYTPTVPGEYKVMLRAAVQPGELKTTNNEITTYVTVSAEGLNVLYIEGTARVEQTFLRRSLDASPDIHVDYLELDAHRPEQRPSDLLKRFAPGAYDVYLLGDIDSTAFTAEELTSLATAVRQGAGLAMLGGIHSFGPGGYGATPLAEVLPVTMDRFERQNFGEGVRTDQHLPGPFRIVPTQAGGTQSLLQLAAGLEQNLAAWRALPPLEGANRFGAVAPGGLVLATSDGAEPAPLIVSRDYARGRVLAIAADSTWRWRMRGFEAAHKRFWRRTVLWLAHKEDQTGENVWLRLAQRSFSPGAQLEFEVGAQTSEGTSIPDAVFAAVVTGPDGQKYKTSVRRRGAETFGELTLPPGPSGDYLVEVSADDAQKKPLGKAQARFHVFGQDLELDNPNAYPGMLKSLAEMTAGGRQIEIKDFADVVRELQKLSVDRRSETPELQSLWDRWEFLATFVMLLCSEWFLRKKWGLV
ncbi:MAG: hypothetical protein QM775_33910 [Pirellulales bacterium]